AVDCRCLSPSAALLLRCYIVSTPPPPPELYTLSLHDALPISQLLDDIGHGLDAEIAGAEPQMLGADAQRDVLSGNSGAGARQLEDRKSTRLNSSHVKISYAVFCLKKKKQATGPTSRTNRTSPP